MDEVKSDRRASALRTDRHDASQKSNSTLVTVLLKPLLIVSLRTRVGDAGSEIPAGFVRRKSCDFKFFTLSQPREFVLITSDLQLRVVTLNNDSLSSVIERVQSSSSCTVAKSRPLI